MNKILMLYILLGLIIISLFVIVIFEGSAPCKEYKTHCYYGTRNTHTVDCTASINSIPNGYSIHRERSCIRR